MTLSLREKILLPTIVTIVTGMLIAIIYGYFSSTEAVKEIVSAGLNREVALNVKMMDNWLSSRINDLNSWRSQQAYIEAVSEREFYLQKAGENLAKQAKGYTFFEFLFITDLKGDIISASHPFPSPVNIKDRAYFRDAVKGRSSISDLLISRRSGKQVFVISVPIKKDDEIIGVLSGAVRHSTFSALFIDDFELGKNGHACLINKDGLTIGHSDKQNAHFQSIQNYDFGQKIISQENGILIYQYEEINMISCFKQLIHNNWIFIETQSLEEAYASSKKTGIYSILIVFITCTIVCLIIGILFRHMLYRPVNEVIRIFAAVEKGRFDKRIEGPLKSDVIGIMSSAFNGMIARLERSVGELGKHRDNLEELVQSRTGDLEQEIKERRRVEQQMIDGEKRLRKQNASLRQLGKERQVFEGDFSAAIHAVTKAACDTLNTERASVWLFEKRRKKLVCRTLFESRQQVHTKGDDLWAIDCPDYLTSLKNDRILAISDVATDPRVAPFFTSYLSYLGIGSILDATIWVSGEMAGIIRCEHIGEKRLWMMDEQNFVASAADFISLALERTERSHAEEEKSQLETRLHRAEKMEAIGTLAGGVAHDLNNILSGVLSYPELLLLQIPADSPLRKPISIIHDSGKKAAAIVQDLLTLARRGVSTTEVLNLNRIIEDYLESPEHQRLMSLYPEITIETRFEENILKILGSPIHLFKTMMNLVTNAAEAISKSGNIIISTQNRYVDQPIRGYDNVLEGDYVTVQIIDSGSGISEKDMDRIFEPFYTKKEMGRSGTGLGMAVVWGTVKDHKGYIDCSSQLGNGTIFTLYFPVTRKEISRQEPSPSLDSFMGRGEFILVVDDIKEQRNIASVILKELRYAVHTVASGEEAIEYMQTHSVDLLVLDMIMDPGMDGLDTYKRVIRDKPKQKALITSGFSETDRIKEALKLGVGMYLKKPYTIENFGSAIKKVLNS